MQRVLCSFAVLCIAAVPAMAQTTAESVIKTAIEAHGGADNLNKYVAGTSKMKGDMTVFGMELEFTGENAYQLPGKFKMTINAEVAGQKLAIVQIANGAKIKNTMNGMAIPLGDAEKLELAQAAAMQEVTQLTPLIGSKKYTLKLEKDEEVNEAPTQVVLVTAKEFKDTRLYFDKKTHFLVKTSRKGLAPSMGEPKEVTEEALISDYKKVNGVMVAMKILVNHDGKKFMSVLMSDVTVSEKLDAGIFAVDD